MSTAQAPALRAHLQTLCQSGAAIAAFPDRADLITTWGAEPYDIAKLVALVRENCPQGYFVPFVCKHTNMKVIMARGNGHLFTSSLLASMASISYCRTRLKNVNRDLRNMAAGFPASSTFRTTVELWCTQMDALTAPAMGGMGGSLAVAMSQLPLLARRSTMIERRELMAWAAEYAV